MAALRAMIDIVIPDGFEIVPLLIGFRPKKWAHTKTQSGYGYEWTKVSVVLLNSFFSPHILMGLNKIMT